MQRNFEPMKRQVEQWQEAQIPDVTAKLIIYRAFVDGELEAPSSLMAAVHRNYFQPLIRSSQHEPFGAYATPSPARSKTWIPFPNSKPPPNSGSFSRKCNNRGRGSLPFFSLSAWLDQNDKDNKDGTNFLKR